MLGSRQKHCSVMAFQVSSIVTLSLVWMAFLPSPQTSKDFCGQFWEVHFSHVIVSLLMESLLTLLALGVEKLLIQCITDSARVVSFTRHSHIVS